MNDDDRIHDDEIVSAVLDGDATADERERVASEPHLTARLDEFRQVRDAVAAPVDPLDEVTRRRLIDRALDAAPASGGATRAAIPPRRPSRRWGTAGAAVASAAVLVLLAFTAGPALVSLGGDDDDGASDDVASAEQETTDAGAMLYRADEAATGGSPDLDALEADGASIPWIGRHDDADRFTEAARLAVASPSFDMASPTTTVPGPPSPTAPVRTDSAFGSAEPFCGEGILDEALARVGGMVGVVRGELDGRMLLAVVPVDDTSRAIVAIDLVSCELVELADPGR